MPLVSVKEILEEAEERGFGVVSFLCFNHETIKWAIESAEEEKMPVIIMMFPGMAGLMPFGSFAAVTRELSDGAKVPVGLHLDHSQSYEAILCSIGHGFRSVMIDGSSFDFEKNVAMTGEVARAAHAMGAIVEAELGHVGSASIVEDFQSSGSFTDPGQAAEFIERTGADSLAVAFGNAHGNYAATPDLNIGLLKKIDAAVKVPLVLHGGTGIPDGQIKEAVRNGIRKMNIGTTLFATYYKAMDDYTRSGGDKNVFKFYAFAEKAMKEVMRSRIAAMRP
jgi:ketose-bisphosphate aldolase